MDTTRCIASTMICIFIAAMPAFGGQNENSVKYAMDAAKSLAWVEVTGRAIVKSEILSVDYSDRYPRGKKYWFKLQETHEINYSGSAFFSEKGYLVSCAHILGPKGVIDAYRKLFPTESNAKHEIRRIEVTVKIAGKDKNYRADWNIILVSGTNLLDSKSRPKLVDYSGGLTRIIYHEFADLCLAKMKSLDLPPYLKLSRANGPKTDDWVFTLNRTDKELLPFTSVVFEQTKDQACLENNEFNFRGIVKEGNSGSPLLNVGNEVVGVVCHVCDPGNYSSAVPAAKILELMP